MLQLFRKTFRVLGRERPGRWVAVVAGAVLVSLLEMVAALLVYLLLALVVDPSAPLEIPLLGDARSWFPGVDDRRFVLGAVGVLAAFFAVRMLLQTGFLYVKHRLAQGAAARVSSTLAEGYLRLPYAVHLRRTSAELVRNAHQTAEQAASQFFLPIIQVLADGLVVVGLLAVLLVITPAGTAMAMVVVGGAAVVLLIVVQPRLERLGAQAQELRTSNLGLLQQSLHGIRDIKVVGGERHVGRIYERSRHRLGRTLYLRGFVSELPRQVIETALVAVLLVLLAVSVTGATGTERLVSTLGVFGYAGLRMLPSLQRTVAGLNNLRFASAAIEQVHDDLELLDGLDDDRDDGTDVTFDRELRLEGVSFAYDRTDHPAIGEVDLTIRPGEAIGVCGPTGGGKTTLADLITGILVPTTGSVTVDGVDVHGRSRAWFRKLGVVPQMVYLTDDTLRRNIALGVADEDIDDEAVAEAVRLAQLEPFVATLPDGLDTYVGERGVRISGGERQRVAIARALYRRPQLLIFDEGTSALDTATEADVIGALQRLRGSHTLVMVAHRLSTVRACDRIVYVEAGRVAAVGDYDTLEATHAGFRALTRNS